MEGEEQIRRSARRVFVLVAVVASGAVIGALLGGSWLMALLVLIVAVAIATWRYRYLVRLLTYWTELNDWAKRSHEAQSADWSAARLAEIEPPRRQAKDHTALVALYGEIAAGAGDGRQATQDQREGLEELWEKVWLGRRSDAVRGVPGDG